MRSGTSAIGFERGECCLHTWRFLTPSTYTTSLLVPPLRSHILSLPRYVSYRVRIRGSSSLPLLGCNNIVSVERHSINNVDSPPQECVSLPQTNTVSQATMCRRESITQGFIALIANHTSLNTGTLPRCCYYSPGNITSSRRISYGSFQTKVHLCGEDKAALPIKAKDVIAALKLEVVQLVPGGKDIEGRQVSSTNSDPQVHGASSKQLLILLIRTGPGREHSFIFLRSVYPNLRQSSPSL